MRAEVRGALMARGASHRYYLGTIGVADFEEPSAPPEQMPCTSSCCALSSMSCCFAAAAESARLYCE